MVTGSAAGQAGPAAWRVPRFRLDGPGFVLALVTLYVGVFCLLPMARLLVEALTAGDPAGLAFVAEVWARPAARTATLNTLEASLLATLVSVALGGGMALAIALTDLRGKAPLVFLLILPLLIPPQISALAWLEMIGPQSLLWQVPGLEALRPVRNPLYGRDGIVLVMGIEHAPMVFLAMRAGLRDLPRDLLDAARAAGARPARITATIVLPLALPSLFAGALLAFVSAIGNFGVPALLGIPGRYPMLTTLIYQRLAGFGPTVLGEMAALALILALIAGAVLALQAVALRRFAVPVDRTGGEHPGFRLGRARLPATAAAWALMTVVAILPLASLLGAALVPAVGVRLSAETATLRNLLYVAFELAAGQRAFANSLSLALGASIATALVAAPLAWLAVTRRSGLARFLSFIADAPYVLPGIVLGVAMILLFLRPLPGLGFSLYNTIWILLVAYMARFLALALRLSVAGIAQIEPALEEAARMTGARPIRRLVTIVLPLAAPAIGAGMLLVFLGAFSELTVSALIWSRGNETVGVLVFSLHDEGNSVAAAAVSVWVLAVVLGIAAILTMVGRRLPRGVLPWQA